MIAGDDPRLARADRLSDLGRHAEAERLLGEVLAEQPDNARAWAARSRCFFLLDDGDQCYRAAGRSLALEPASEWAHRLRASGASMLGHHDEAVRHAREAVRIAPESHRPYICLANVLSKVTGLRRRRSLGEAWDAAERSIALAPDDADCHITAGYVALSRGRLRDAVRANRRALELEPDSANALYNLAMARRHQRSFVPLRSLLLAARDLGGLLTLRPDEDEARQALDRIASSLTRSILLMSLWPYIIMLGLSVNQTAGHHAVLILIRRIAGGILALGWAAGLTLSVRHLPRQVLAYLFGSVKRRLWNATRTAAVASAVFLPCLMGWLPDRPRLVATVIAGALIIPFRVIDLYVRVAIGVAASIRNLGWPRRRQG